MQKEIKRNRNLVPTHVCLKCKKLSSPYNNFQECPKCRVRNKLVALNEHTEKKEFNVVEITGEISHAIKYNLKKIPDTLLELLLTDCIIFTNNSSKKIVKITFDNLKRLKPNSKKNIKEIKIFKKEMAS